MAMPVAAISDMGVFSSDTGTNESDDEHSVEDDDSEPVSRRSHAYIVYFGGTFLREEKIITNMGIIRTWMICCRMPPQSLVP